MRKSYDTAFKVKVALEAAKEQMTLQELAQKFDVSPGQISQWKKQLVEGAGELFERPNKKLKREREIEEARDNLPRRGCFPLNRMLRRENTLAIP